MKTKKTQIEFYETYAEAQKACAGLGYEDDGLVRVVFEKTRLLKVHMLSGEMPLSEYGTQSLLAVLMTWHQIGDRDRLRVIDFGGACGAHYFQIRPFLPRDVRLDWVVIETPAMVKKARSIEADELHFAASMREAKERLAQVDLLHSSGTLQYVSDLQAALKSLLDSRPAFIFMNRLVLSASDSLISVQESMLGANGPGPLPDGIQDRVCKYPVTYFSEEKLEQALSQNYQFKLRFDASRAVLGGRDIVVNAGFFAEAAR